jgi:PKD repeat protein
MHFTNTSNGATSYEWNFGDGDESTATSPSHEYTAVGSYTVVLTATSGVGGVDVYSDTVVVSGYPTAGFTSDSPVCLRKEMHFTNTSSGAISYEWNFGDGLGSTATNPSHEYAAAGNYTVVLTATNGSGCSDVFSSTVMVNVSPTAGFTSNSPIEPDETMVFTNTSTGAISYEWNFGDGVGTSTEENPVYLYEDLGIYTVVLTVTNALGCNDVYQASVRVGDYRVFLPLSVRNHSSLTSSGPDLAGPGGGEFKMPLWWIRASR